MLQTDIDYTCIWLYERNNLYVHEYSIYQTWVHAGKDRAKKTDSVKWTGLGQTEPQLHSQFRILNRVPLAKKAHLSLNRSVAVWPVLYDIKFFP